MELLDRYLKAVRSYLPEALRDDVAEELEENIRSQIDDLEAELGRPLDEAEQEALLKRHGNPMVVAGRYRQDQGTLAFGRQLIGPVLFPFYVNVLGFNLGITAVVCALITIALGKPTPETFRAVVTQLLVQFTIVTLIFTAVERHLAAFPDRWNPRAATPVVKDERRVPRLESFSQLVSLSIFLLWLLAVRSSSDLFSNPARADFQLGPVWQQVYLPVVLITLLGIVQACVNLIRPRWTRLRASVHAATTGTLLVIVGYLLKAGNWVVLTAADPVGDKRRAVEVINHYVFFYSLLVSGVVCGAMFLLEVRRLIRGERSVDQSASGRVVVT